MAFVKGVTTQPTKRLTYGLANSFYWRRIKTVINYWKCSDLCHISTSYWDNKNAKVVYYLFCYYSFAWHCPYFIHGYPTKRPSWCDELFTWTIKFCVLLSSFGFAILPPYFVYFYFFRFSFACGELMNDKPLNGFSATPVPDIMAYLMCEIKCCYICTNYFIKIK